MNREVHVRFWESAGLRCPAPLTYLKAYESVAEARRGHRRLLRVLQRTAASGTRLPRPAPGLDKAPRPASSARGKTRAPNTVSTMRWKPGQDFLLRHEKEFATQPRTPSIKSPK